MKQGLHPSISLAICVLASAACTGYIGAKGSNPTGISNSSGNPPLVDPAKCVVSGPPRSTRIRRLNSDEIQSSIAQSLGSGVMAPLALIQRDRPTNGLFSNSDYLKVSSSLANAMNVAMETIGSDFKSTVTRTTFDATCFGSDDAGMTCAESFIRTFGKKAFRRPITDDDVAALMPVYQAGREVGIDGNAGDRFASGLSSVVKAMFQAPDFLYLTELGDPAAANGATTKLLPHEVASALSYAVVGLPPDDALTAAADQNQLVTADQRNAQVRRLIDAASDGWRANMRRFVTEWLNVDFDNPNWQKNSDVVRMYSSAVKAAVQTETSMLIDDWSTSAVGSRLDDLLVRPVTFVNSVNAPIYGLTRTGTAFQRVDLDPTERAGILTLAGFLGTTSRPSESSPVLRGKVILQKFLCREPQPPPPDVPSLPVDSATTPKTTRQRFEAHLSNPVCAGCHSQFDPMGNAFEEYDALGVFRSQENGQPIDSSGALVGASNGDIPVTNAIELSKVLAGSIDTKDCVSRQMFRYAIGHTEGESDACTIAVGRQALATGQMDVRDLLSSIIRSDSFVVRTVQK